MTVKHILFFLAPQYGHMNPSLGTAMELIRQGHRVSYATSESFAPLVRNIGATAIVLNSPEVREQTIPYYFKENDHLNFYTDPEKLAKYHEVVYARSAVSMQQLEDAYRDVKPDFVLYDDVLDVAGHEFAKRYRIPNALLRSQFIHRDMNEECENDERVLVTVPRFFQRITPETPVPAKYRFVGFTPEGRSLGFHQPWRPARGDHPIVLISPTTGLLKQVQFCRKMLDAFRGKAWDVLLSISGSRDAFSALDPTIFENCPPNVHINQGAANFDILRDADLYIGQGGQGSVLEAIYHGVSQIVVPASAWHYPVGQRLDELGLGACMPFSELSSASLIERANALVKDRDTRERIEAARQEMHDERSSERAAETIEQWMSA